jgi:NADPH:quinone reductase-like Zn-dependent oxidoreductase
VLEFREVDEPQARDDDVLVRVRAASVNPADWYAVTPVVERTYPLREAAAALRRLGQGHAKGRLVIVV